MRSALDRAIGGSGSLGTGAEQHLRTIARAVPALMRPAPPCFSPHRAERGRRRRTRHVITEDATSNRPPRRHQITTTRTAGWELFSIAGALKDASSSLARGQTWHPLTEPFQDLRRERCAASGSSRLRCRLPPAGLALRHDHGGSPHRATSAAAVKTAAWRELSLCRRTRSSGVILSSSQPEGLACIVTSSRT